MVKWVAGLVELGEQFGRARVVGLGSVVDAGDDDGGELAVEVQGVTRPPVSVSVVSIQVFMRAACNFVVTLAGDRRSCCG